jgi:hypothetical protein
MAPRGQPEGPRKAGIGQRRGCFDRSKDLLGRLHPLRDRIFLWKTLLRPTRSHHSRCRLSHIPSRKATVAPVICSALP